MADPFDIDITDIDMPEANEAKRDRESDIEVRADGSFTNEELEMFTREELEGVSRVSEEQVTGICCLEIHSPKELWAVGAVKITYQLGEGFGAIEAIDDANVTWESIRVQFDDELAAATARENQMTLAQRNKIEELVEEAGDELPEGFDEFSKSQASKCIQEAIGATNNRSRSNQTTRRGTQRSPRSSRSRRNARGGSSKRGSSSGRSSNRGGSGGDFSNLQGEITSGQVRFIKSLCDDLDIDPDAGYQNWSSQEASDYIKELQEERDN